MEILIKKDGERHKSPNVSGGVNESWLSSPAQREMAMALEVGEDIAFSFDNMKRSQY